VARLAEPGSYSEDILIPMKTRLGEPGHREIKKHPADRLGALVWVSTSDLLVDIYS